MTETTPSNISRRGVLTAAAWSVPVVAASATAPLGAATDCPDDGWTWMQVWSDEFEGPAGSAPDPTKWTYDLGSGWDGWGNWELQNYTNSRENSYLDGDGFLHIVAKPETTTMPDGNGNPVTKQYTSARLLTRDLYEPTYGRIEARIKVPSTVGLLPAFWALGANHYDAPPVWQPWPECGEIDIMEIVGARPNDPSSGPNQLHANVHGPGYSGANGIGAHIASPIPWTDDFHIYAIEWEENSIKWFVDGILYHQVTPDTVPGAWAFNHSFAILMNVAVGGSWPGSPDGTSTFPQEMIVDYVRHFERVQVSC